MNDPYPVSAGPTASRPTYQPAIFQVSGRLGRMRYFVYLVAVGVVAYGFLALFSLVVNIAGHATVPGLVLVVVTGASILANGVALVMSILLGVRRLNDMNASGWFMLLMLIPLVNLVFWLVLLFVPGSHGPNRYGAPTVANSAGLRLALLILILMLLGWAGIFGGAWFAITHTDLQQTRPAPTLHHTPTQAEQI